MATVPEGGPWPVGTYVWFWFDTGAMGVSQCIGVVRQSGPKTALIEWPNGVRNRLHYGKTEVKPCEGLTLEIAREEWAERERRNKR